MPVSDPDVFRPRLIRDATFLETPAGSRRFPSISSASVSTCVCARSTPPPANGWRFLEDEAQRLDRTASLLAWARGWLRDEHHSRAGRLGAAPGGGAARHKARSLLKERMAEHLSATMRDGLDALVAVGDDHPHSPLHDIGAGTSSPSVGGMKRFLARLESIEATGVLDIDVNWVNGNQRILFHSVRTVSADRVRDMAAPRRHLALVWSCTRLGATRSTRPSTCTAGSSNGATVPAQGMSAS